MIASPRRQSNNPMWGKPRGGFPQGCNPTISILMYEPRTSHQVGTQQSKETARRSSSSFGLYHGQRRSPVETHRKSLLQEEGSRAGRSLTPSRPMTASIPLEFTEKVFCIKSWHNSQGIVGSCVHRPGWRSYLLGLHRKSLSPRQYRSVLLICSPNQAEAMYFTKNFPRKLYIGVNADKDCNFQELSFSQCWKYFTASLPI